MSPIRHFYRGEEIAPMDKALRLAAAALRGQEDKGTTFGTTITGQRIEVGTLLRVVAVTWTDDNLDAEVVIVAPAAKTGSRNGSKKGRKHVPTAR